MSRPTLGIPACPQELVSLLSLAWSWKRALSWTWHVCWWSPLLLVLVRLGWVEPPSHPTRESSPCLPPRWCWVVQQRSKRKETATVFGREAHANGRTATKQRRTRRLIRRSDASTSQPNACGADCEETRDGGCGGWPAKPKNSLRNPPASWKRNTRKASSIRVVICVPAPVLEREMESKTTPTSGSREERHPSNGSRKLHR